MPQTQTMLQRQILTPEQMKQKIKRMAVEILERNLEQDEIVIAGIRNEGYALSSLLVTEIRSYGQLNVKQVAVTLDKTAITQPLVKFDKELGSFSGKPFVIVDDVLNTGRTLWYVLNALSSVYLPKIEIAVMVARNHSLFPIRPDFVGYGLSTSLSDHVRVEIPEQGDMKAYLLG